jgi:hypothetical protein
VKPPDSVPAESEHDEEVKRLDGAADRLLHVVPR